MSKSDVPNENFPSLDVQFDKLTLPMFDGNLTNWISFRDQFTDLIHKNPLLTPVIKFTMLRNHLSGQAADAINGFKLSGIDYEAAWSVLMKRYDRPDKIIDEHLRRFHKLPKLCSPPTAPQLFDMANSANTLIRVLPNLGQNVKDWDIWMIFHLKERLDPGTLTKWTDNTKGRQNIKLPEFMEFLEFEALQKMTLQPLQNRHRNPLFHISTEPVAIQHEHISETDQDSDSSSGNNEPPSEDS